ncbi:SPOR domain-containing protein [Rhodoferax sp.]|uniref:SPOR domain-containing protein n=1 Tax=Rhodoferax sp. TaxID=50421 RepID=UPI00283F9931|nr:SPOR domain-containing protein [Rhodoferax sp.]MDR3368659.1 SPOR domain-containing protein [Rhodoferax sp.]
MAFFKFRKGADESARAPAQPQSIEAIRQRAKYRLAGATVLVLVGVVGLPMLFDKQPRPIAVDTPISIPDKNKVPPLVMPDTGVKAAVASASASSVTSAPSVDTPAAASPPVSIDKKAEGNKASAPVDKGQKATNTIVTESPQPTKPEISAVVPKAPVKAPPVAAPVPVSTAKSDANRAQALLDGKVNPPKMTKVDASKVPAVKPAASAPDGRFIVQVGAYADNAHAHEVRLKLEHAGLKTYAQAVDTKDGKRIRVRIGPFASKAEAEKAAEKIKKLNLPAALLTL